MSEVITFTLDEIKKQGEFAFNVINEIRPIINDKENDDSTKLVRVLNLLGLMTGAIDFTIKKMTEAGKESATREEVIEYGKEYLEVFKKANGLEVNEESQPQEQPQE